jgi:hypothetical protein
MQSAKGLWNMEKILPEAVSLALDARLMTNHSTMFVEKSAMQAINACKVDSTFGEVKWPAKTLRVQYEADEVYDISVSRGSTHEIIDHLRKMLEAGAFTDQWDGQYCESMYFWLNRYWHKREVPIFDGGEVLMYAIKTSKGKCYGNIPLEYSFDQLNDGIMETAHAWKDSDIVRELGDPMVVGNTIMSSLKMLLAVFAYSSISYFRPQQINKKDERTKRKLKSKGFSVPDKGGLMRVVYLPRVVREYAKKQGNASIPRSLENGRIGHVRTLRSDYYTNMQGQQILIPPIPDKTGRYPQVIYKVRKPNR